MGGLHCGQQHATNLGWAGEHQWDQALAGTGSSLGSESFNLCTPIARDTLSEREKEIRGQKHPMGTVSQTAHYIITISHAMIFIKPAANITVRS